MTLRANIVGIQVKPPTQDLEALSRRLRELGGTPLQRQLRAALVKAAKPAATAVKQSALAIPVKGPKHTGLRKQLAAATRVSVRTAGPTVGVRIAVSGAQMPEGKENLPALMEGWERWRHPFFGDYSRWYGQPAHPYFFRTLDRHLPRIARDVDRVVDDIVRELKL